MLVHRSDLVLDPPPLSPEHALLPGGQTEARLQDPLAAPAIVFQTVANEAPSPRFHDLDALRGVAMFLGILLHAGVFVLPEPQSLWPIHAPAASGDRTYLLLIETIHGFRMPVFFLISGFFTAMLWQRRGLGDMIRHRLRRVGIPFGVACLTVLPASIWLLAVAGDFQPPYDIPVWALPLVWAFSLGHLWFLWYLLLLFGGLFVAVRAGLLFRHPAWWLVVPSSMALSLAMVEPIFGADNADSIVPDLAILGYYACFFLFGVFFYQRGWTVRRWWTVALLPAGAAFYAGFRLLWQYLSASDAPVPFLFYDPLTLSAALIETVCAWLMCFGLIGLFRWIAARESFAVRYFSDASYWMYLAHLPLVIAGQMLVLELPIHYHFKFLLVCGGVSLVLLLSYQFGVRYTVIGRALNGPRTRRQQSRDVPAS